MKIALSLALIAFAPIFTFAQNYLGDLYKGLPEGRDTVHYSNGKVYNVYEIVAGNIHGESRSYHRNGNLFKVYHFNQGRFDGYVTTFDKNQDTTDVEFYKNDTLLTLVQTRYRINNNPKFISMVSFTIDSTLTVNPFNVVFGNISHKKPQENSNTTCKEYNFYRDGTTKSLTHFVNDIANGPFTLFNKNSQLIEETNYIDGVIDPINKEYFDSGELKSTCTYLDGKPDGDFIEYNKDGTILRKTKYALGKKVK